MLIDDVTITIKAGDGGNGSASFKRNAQTAKGGPDGGNGGNGGNVYFVGVNDISALTPFRYKKKVAAEDGIAGARQNLYGRNGKDLYVPVPIGTHVTDLANGSVIEIVDAEPVLLAKGGKGGRGNNEFKTAILQTPKFAEPGGPGEERQLHLVLKLIADIGFIGLPNAGKSSMLTVLTNANPKIGNYPFTTLEPNIGMLDTIALADIPGLIEGASHGRGLGTKFLKHIEKTKLLVHCIDSTIENPLETYQTVRKEFEEYNPALLTKPEVILLTKIDLVDDGIQERNMKALTETKREVRTMSIYDETQIADFKEFLISFVKRDK